MGKKYSSTKIAFRTFDKKKKTEISVNSRTLNRNLFARLSKEERKVGY